MSIRSSLHRLPALGVTLLVSLVGACTMTSAEPEDPRVDGAARVTLGGGLTQRVSVEPASPMNGANVTINSVIVNEGSAAATLTSRICGLDYEGALELTHPPEVLKCAGVSQSGALAPGDTVAVSDLMRVASGPGTYTLRVRHALDPAQWVSVEVVVRAP